MPLALLMALAGSLAIHAAAMFGSDFELLAEPAEPPPLRAELRPPPVAPASANAAPDAGKPPPPPAAARTVPARKAPRMAVPANSLPAPPAGAMPPSGAAMETDPVSPSTAAATEAPPPAALLPAAGVIRFAIYKESLGMPVGRAEHRWEFPGDGSYRLLGISETSGLVAVFKPVRIENESRGRLVAGGLRPDSFRTLRNGRETSENADFDWSTGEVRLARDGSVQSVARGTQDLLSLNYQLAWLGRLEEGSGIGVVTGKKYAFYALDSLGEETLETPAGTFRTLHLRAMTDSVTEVWIALDRQRLPVKIRFTDKKGDSFVQIATEIGSE